MASVHIDWEQSLFRSKIHGEEYKNLSEHDVRGACGKVSHGSKIMLAQLLLLVLLLFFFFAFFPADF